MITLPTLNQIYNTILADLNAEFNISIPLFGKNFLRALAAVQAGKLWIYYKAVGFLQKNIFADTADSEAIGGTLERFGRIKLGRNPFPATAGQYDVSLTGSVGGIVPASMTFKSDDSSTSPGHLYVLDIAYTLDGTDIITIRSLDTGLEARLSIGDTLTATGPMALVDAQVTVVTEVVAPIAAETLEDYRRKVLDSFRLEAQGGAGADYRLWAFEVQGVFQAYPYAASGQAGVINLFIEATVADSIDGKGTPSTALLDAVEDSIELPTVDRPSRKPLGVYDVVYLPITAKDIDIEIAGFVGLNPTIETSILNAIKADLDKVRPFVSSIDILANRNDVYDTNRIVAAILIANPGSVFGAVTMSVDGVPISPYTFLNGDIPYLNSITYV